MLSAKITSSKLTASTYYEGKAKELVTIGFAIRSDTDANGNYRFDSEESTLTNVTGKTASLFISAGSKKYIKSVTEHYIKTSAEESSKTYTLTV
ncbi:MAG: hypothetical protein LUH82_04895 [Clostridiales bacterium]|nr:hypothetical protein [Clostridiales bacterium]